jgi:hypothetical protein
VYGLPKLRVEEDYRLASALLPLSRGAALNDRFVNFFDGLGWQQLLVIVRGCAETAQRNAVAAGRASHAAAYLVEACRMLQESHLREAAQPTPDIGIRSVLPWRVRNSCEAIGLFEEWTAMAARLGRTGLVAAAVGDGGGAAPPPMLRYELRRLQLAANSVGCEIVALQELAQSLDKAAVLYLAGHQDRSQGLAEALETLDVAGVWLVVLNICVGEALAKKLLARGAGAVICWSSKVPDAVAVDFGAALVTRLHVQSIQEAFDFAKVTTVPACERAPKLLFRAQNADNPVAHCDDMVTLAFRNNSGKSEYAGLSAKVLPNTEIKGWVTVQVGSETIRWRRGHWIVSERCHSPSEGTKLNSELVMLQFRRNSGQSSFAGKQARVLHRTAINGWVNVMVESDIVKWRVGHWTKS